MTLILKVLMFVIASYACAGENCVAAKGSARKVASCDCSQAQPPQQVPPQDQQNADDADTAGDDSSDYDDDASQG